MYFSLCVCECVQLCCSFGWLSSTAAAAALPLGQTDSHRIAGCGCFCYFYCAVSARQRSVPLPSLSLFLSLPSLFLFTPLLLPFPHCLLGSGKWLRVWLTCLKTAGLPLRRSLLPAFSLSLPSLLPTLAPFALLHSPSPSQRHSTLINATFACCSCLCCYCCCPATGPASAPCPLSMSTCTFISVCSHSPLFPTLSHFLSVSLFVRFSTVHLPARLSSNSAVPWPVSVSANVHDFSASSPSLYHSLFLSLSVSLYICCLCLHK